MYAARAAYYKSCCTLLVHAKAAVYGSELLKTAGQFDANRGDRTWSIEDLEHCRFENSA